MSLGRPASRSLNQMSIGAINVSGNGWQSPHDVAFARQHTQMNCSKGCLFAFALDYSDIANQATHPQ